MGTGKTTIGMRVARSLGFRFVDTDKMVEKAAGKPISDIFAEDGEERFREMESSALRSCALGESQVIATGGGIVTRPENHPLLREAGYVIWLKASPETIYARVRRNRKRPLLQTPDPLGTIRELLAARTDLYATCAELSIATDDLSMEETCFGVTESALHALGPS